MDPLSLALRSLQMSGSLIARAEVTEPWGLGLDRFGAAVFHVILSGTGWLETEHGRKLRLAPGDVVVLMLGEAHRLTSQPGAPVARFSELMEHCIPGRFPTIGVDGGGDRTTLLCGFFNFNRQTSHPLLRSLPDLIHVNAGSAAGMVAGLVALADAESATPRPGSGALTDLICGLLLVQILRAQLAVDPQAAGPWSQSLADARIGTALELMQASPDKSWTVAALASAVAMSRSSFAQRFGAAIGESPMRYLARCRILRAAQLLGGENLSVSEAMHRVGYQSESSFTKAFQRHLGCTPAAYRGSQRHADRQVSDSGSAPRPG